MVANANYGDDANMEAGRSQFDSRLLNLAEVVFLSLDARGCIHHINDFGCRLLGYERSELVGANWFETCIPTYHRDQMRQIFEAVSGGQANAEHYRNPVRTKDGSERVLAWRNLPRNKLERSTQGTISAGVDITDLLLAEQKVKQQEQVGPQLWQQLGSFGQLNILGEMTRGIMHQISQPLTAASNYAQAGLRFATGADPDPAQLERIFQRTNESIMRVREVLLHLQHLAQREIGNPQPCNLNDLIQDILRLTGPEVQGRYPLSLELDPKLNLVMADPRQLQQIMINLLWNALDALELGNDSRAGIYIRTENTEASTVRVSVRDEGVGIPDTMLREIFQPFFTTKLKGLGIGLCICQSLISDCGGQIGVNNQLERGVEFYFTLPALAPSAEQNS